MSDEIKPPPIRLDAEFGGFSASLNLREAQPALSKALTRIEDIELRTKALEGALLLVVSGIWNHDQALAKEILSILPRPAPPGTIPLHEGPDTVASAITEIFHELVRLLPAD